MDDLEKAAENYEERCFREYYGIPKGRVPLDEEELTDEDEAAEEEAHQRRFDPEK